MRRFLGTSFIALALLISAAGAAPAALAATPDEICRDRSETPAEYYACLESEAGLGAISADSPVSDPAAAKTVAGGLPSDPTGSEGFGKIMTWIMSLFAWLVGVAAITLDNAVYFTVVKMGDYVSKLSAVGVTWRILRDIANIMLIFGFLGAGIATILNVDQYGWKTKMLPMLFVAAIFLNFSLFITEAMIDGTNLFATQFYTQINGGQAAGAKSYGDIAGEGISNKIMAQLGLQTLYTAALKPNTQVFAAGNTWIIGFMGIILFIVTAFVLFSLAFILIARFVALIFFIILCPVAFMGLAIPQMQYRAGQWWKNFLEQIITAPILLLLLYVALAVITDASFLTGFGAAKDPNAWLGFLQTTGFNNLPGFASMLLSFLVAMGLLLVVVIKAKSMSAFGAAGAIKLGGKLSFGATAWAGRRTVGRASNYAARAIRSSKIGRSDMGKLFAGIADKGAKASFDIRGVAVGGGLKGIGVDAGEAQKGGYRARREVAIKGQQEYIKSVGEAIDEKGATKKEEKAIIDAETAQASAKAAYGNAKREFDATKAQLEPQIALQEAEVARLTAISKKHMDDYGLPDTETENKLVAAQRQFTASKDSLTTAKNKHGIAAQANKDANDAVKDAITESNDRIGAEKKKAQLRYAESISGSPVNWAMFGPGGAVAARKIVKDARTSPDKKLLDQLKQAIAAGEKSDTTTPAPTAPAAAKPAATTP